MPPRFRWVPIPFVLAIASSPAMANPVAVLRVVSCGAESCLLIQGHSDASRSTIRVNGRPVETDGRASWRVRLPVATVRDWSAPFARTIEIAMVDAAGSVDRRETIRLPVGLLGSRVELASLVVRAR